jgi:uncharacterized protein YuzE
MRSEHDPQADAIYITLREVPYRWGQDLDDSRRVDVGTDNQPCGIELLNVSDGVDVTDLPDCEAVSRVLQEHGITISGGGAQTKAAS